MTRTIRFPIVLVLLFLASLILFLWGSQQMPITDPVESNYALTAKEMVLSGDWISPQIYGTYWYDKPALVYWLLSAAYTVFGFSNFASRFPAAICGALSVVLMAWYVRRIIAKQAVAVWSAIFLATSLEFWIVSHAVITDSMLLLFTIPTMFSAYIGITEKSWTHMTIAYFAAAFACLAKGPVGLVLPGALLFIWCLTTKSFKNVLRLFSPSGILIFILFAAPWYYAMYAIHGQDFIDGFIGLHNVTRALSSEHPEDNYFFYYLVVLPLSLLPWTGLSFYTMVKDWKSKTPLYNFLMIWCWGTVLFYTLVATKYVTYTYIAVLPAILLAGLAVPKLLEEGKKKAQLTLLVPFVLTMLALCGGTYFLEGNFLSLYVIAIYSGGLLFVQWKKQQNSSMFILTTASMAAAYLCIVFGGLTGYIATRSTTDMMDYFKDLPGEHYMYHTYDPSYAFYTGDVPVRIHNTTVDANRDAKWDQKYVMPTVTDKEFFDHVKGQTAYVFVPRGSLKAFNQWNEKDRFEEDQAFASGTIYKFEK